MYCDYKYTFPSEELYKKIQEALEDLYKCYQLDLAFFTEDYELVKLIITGNLPKEEYTFDERRIGEFWFEHDEEKQLQIRATTVDFGKGTLLGNLLIHENSANVDERVCYDCSNYWFLVTSKRILTEKEKEQKSKKFHFMQEDCMLYKL